MFDVCVMWLTTVCVTSSTGQAMISLPFNGTERVINTHKASSPNFGHSLRRFLCRGWSPKSSDLSRDPNGTRLGRRARSQHLSPPHLAARYAYAVDKVYCYRRGKNIVNSPVSFSVLPMSTWFRRFWATAVLDLDDPAVIWRPLAILSPPPATLAGTVTRALVNTPLSPPPASVHGHIPSSVLDARDVVCRKRRRHRESRAARDGTRLEVTSGPEHLGRVFRATTSAQVCKRFRTG